MKQIVLLTLCWIGFNANAALIDFDLSNNGQTTMNVTASDNSFTALFFNPTNEVEGPRFFMELGGLFIGSYRTTYSFDVIFSDEVVWNAFNLLSSSGTADLGVTVAGAGVSVSDLFAGSPYGVTSFSSPITFLAGETYSFSSNYNCKDTYCGGYVVNNWDFSLVTTESTSVSAPATLGLLGLSLIGLAVRRRIK